MKPIKLNPKEFDSFPSEFDVTQKVFEYYFDIAYIGNKPDSLNDAQKALYYHFICDGRISNSGFISILLETNGIFNDGYSKVLHLIGDTTGKAIFDEIVGVYNKYEKWYSKTEVPPALDEDSKEFDKKLNDRIEELEKNWYNGDKARERLFYEYLNKNKPDLVVRE
jgi:hypothetical protein